MSTTEATYVQGGADFHYGSGRKTKTALKKLIKENPKAVHLYDTSAFGSKFSGPADQLPKGMSFIVVGPDPHRDRSWFATVKVGRDGKLVVT